MKVLCFGSLNIDYTYSVDHFVSKGETLSSDGLEVFTGGKGLNQSIALARADAEVYHAGSIGEDGRFLLETMEQAGVHTEYVTVRKDARTGNAIIQRDKEGDNCILLYGGANQMITEEQVEEVLGHFGAGDYLILQNEINQLSYIMRRAHEKSMVIVLNPSPMNEKIRELPLEYVDIFMLNEVEAGQILSCGSTAEHAEPMENCGSTAEPSEAMEICGSTSEHAELAELLSQRFPEATIVLTLGGDGAVCIKKGSKVFQQAYQVDVADTTAAGDTFTGFFIGGLLRGKTEAEAMREASTAAAIACSKVGAAPSIPEKKEVESFIADRDVESGK